MTATHVSARIAPFTRIKAGFYQACPYRVGNIVTVWREGEGPDAGKWFFALAAGLGDTSEPYGSMRSAMDAALIAAA